MPELTATGRQIYRENVAYVPEDITQPVCELPELRDGYVRLYQTTANGLPSALCGKKPPPQFPGWELIAYGSINPTLGCCVIEKRLSGITDFERKLTVDVGNVERPVGWIDPPLTELGKTVYKR